MSDDQFAKLFKYIEEFRNDVDSRFVRVDERIDRLEKVLKEVTEVTGAEASLQLAER